MRKGIQLVNLPFYTQRMTAENWQEEGFSSLAEAESWSGRGCGIAPFEWCWKASAASAADRER